MQTAAAEQLNTIMSSQNQLSLLGFVRPQCAIGPSTSLSSSSTILPVASIMTSHNHQHLPVWLAALPTHPRFPVLQTNHQAFTLSRKLPLAVIQVLGRFNVSGLNNFPGCIIVNPRIVHFVGIACKRRTQIS